MTQTNTDNILPPHDLETERALLGSLMIDVGMIPEVGAILDANAFYQVGNQAIYQAMIDLVNDGAPVDYLTITNRIDRDMVENFDSLEGYLISLMAEVPTSVHGIQYAKIVQEKYQRRQVIRAASEIAKIGYGSDQGTDVISEAEAIIFGLAEDQGPQATVHIKEAVSEIIDIASGDQPMPVGFKTGFIDLDRILKLNRTDMVFVAGRPGMGKTAFLLSIAEHLAAREHAKVAVFSLEMSVAQVATRMLATKGKINAQKISNAELAETDLVQLYEAAGELSQMMLLINPTAAISPQQVMSQARRIQVMHGLDVLIIDYLQLMSPNKQSRNRVEDIGSISRALKQMAKELDVAVVAACQLNRGVEIRKDKRPTIADLRESGDLENDADAIMLIYRDDYYNPDSSERPNIAEINLAKHRHGPTGLIDLYWNGGLTTFRNLVRQHIQL
jgi:replicative DNA helicase